MSSETLSRSTAAAPAAPAPARGGVRDPFLDNAKFLLVVLVVIGHTWAPVADETRALKTAYVFVYSFHMPVFVLLCGYFSRSFTARPDQIRKLVAYVLVPYLIFETVYSGMHTLIWHQPFAITPTEPVYLCWFLIALFVWRLTAPVWRAVRWPVAVAAVISLASGLTDTGYGLALPRVLMFLPWFVLGLRLRPEHFRPLRGPAARRWAVPIMVAAVAGAWWAAPKVDGTWMLMQESAASLGVPPLEYLGVRIGLFVVSAALAAAFLALVPGRRMGFTALGAVTMYPFLLHGLVVWSAEGIGAYDLVRAGGPAALILATLLAGALAVLLCAPVVRRALRPLVEPRFPRLFEPRETRPTGTPDAASGTPDASGESDASGTADDARGSRATGGPGAPDRLRRPGRPRESGTDNEPARPAGPVGAGEPGEPPSAPGPRPGTA